ncbi:MAG TPA: DEAD/DEAH box helicase [Anaerolineales bacterium]|nr:DEAD/DEAH box helicase [Anaerolineales bacterium]
MTSDIQEQIERRRERARAEILKIANKGSHPVFSLFEVSSVSKKSYRVEIRSLDELQNSCTCPDYKSNLIGTCKHIEGVLIYLEKEHGKKLKKLAEERPRGTQIYLHHGMDITVRVALPIPDRAPIKDLLNRYFDPSGLLVGAPLQALPALLSEIESLPTRDRSLVRVNEAVHEHLSLLQDREEIQQQKEWFLDQVKRGRRTFDVLSTKLYPYQEQGAMHLAFGRRAMLADDMGLGKTVQAIAASALLKEMRDIQKALIICPASLKHQWAREIRRFTSLSVTVVEGGLLERRKLYNDSSFFKIINYELVRYDLDELLKLRPDLIILDEAQRIKNWRAKTAMMVKSLPSRYAFVLTGTPLENRIDELYSIFQFLDPRILGPLWHFNDRFYELEKRESGTYKVLGYKNIDELRALIKPYTLRRTRDEVLKDLPPRTDNNFFVEMTDPQWDAYNEFKEHLAKLVAIAKRRPLTPKERELLLMYLIKMRLICNALALHDKEIEIKDSEKTAPKLGELDEILTEEIASNGHKAVIFSQWANMLALTEPIIQRVGLGYVKLTGAVPSAKRGDLIQKFFDDPECRIFLSTDAGGVGLNLQAASLVINLDLPWNPAVLEQRIARAHRHGQRSSVQVINLVAKDTIEERMLDTLAAKKNVFATVFGTDEAPTAIKFADLGQSLLQKLGDLLKTPAEVELALAPTEVAPVTEEAAPLEEIPAPTLKDFASLLLDRLPNRIQLVRKAPHMPGATGEGVIVVVSGAPADVRPAVEAALNEHYIEDMPQLHLMDSEGYQSLSSFIPALAQAPAPEDVAYRATSLPAPARQADLPSARRKRATEGLAFAEKRLALADLLLKGNFPEEMTRPLRESLGWGLTSLLTLHTDRDPSSDLPSPRLIQAELVERGHLPAELSQKLSQARDLTAQPEVGEEAVPLSAQTGQTLLESVKELVALAQEQIVKSGL